MFKQDEVDDWIRTGGAADSNRINGEDSGN
jgi:hypothetical protein